MEDSPKGENMRITKVEVIRVPTSSPPWGPTFCRIWTDTGIYGDGEAAMCYGSAQNAAFGILKDYANLIIGMDPLDNEVIWDRLHKCTFWGQNGGPITFAGISAIDEALWDIKGKYFKVPLYVLLGGKFRDKLHSYASQLQHGWEKDWEGNEYGRIPKSAEDYAMVAKQAMDEGYDVVKYDFLAFDENGRSLTTEMRTGILEPKHLKLVESRIAAIREVCGDDLGIIVENHSYTDAFSSVQIGRLIEKYNILLFEEPNTPTPYMQRDITEKVHIPQASGERIYSRWQYVPYFENRSLQVIQPDIGNCGGITEVKKIADMAHAYDVAVQAHVCASPFSTSVAMHLEAAIPNFAIHEHHVVTRFTRNYFLAKYNPQPVNGYLEVSNEPGIGNEIGEACWSAADQYAVIKEAASVGYDSKDKN